MAKISVVIPVYNVEKYIRQCLDSVVNQTLQDIEIIIVDDGTPDNSGAIADEYAKQDSRIKVLHQKNAGVSTARNNGLQMATGEYVYFADSDDWLETDAFIKLWEAIEETGADLVYGDWYSESSKGTAMKVCFPKPFVTEDPETIHTLQRGCYNNRKVRVKRPEFDTITHLGGAPWRYIVRRAVIVDNHLSFDPYVKGLGDDILFVLHLYEYVKKVAYIQTPIYHYRIVEASTTHGFKPNLLSSYERIFERHRQFLKDYQKDALTERAFYIRVLLYFDESMARYFKNAGNNASEKDRFREMKKTLKKEPYKSAVAKAPLKEFYSGRCRGGFMLLRLRMYKLYWMLKR